jgi:DNA repair protein RadD
LNYTLRNYQQEAVDSVAKSIGAGNKRMLVIAATGAGKSLMIASLIHRFLTRYQDQRVLVLAHQSTLIKQNAEKIRSFCPDRTVGIYCAELDEKNTSAQIILASRDSLVRKPETCGRFGMVLLDEAHLASEELEAPKSQYGKIFCAQSLETLFVIGFTATPWRLKSGNIWGDNKFFKKCVYNIGTDFLISKGFLSPYVYPESKKIIDPGSIKKTAGDFNLGELESCSIRVVEQSLAEWRSKAEGRDLTLFFCVGKYNTF